MKRQPRPFTIELKTSRKPALPPRGASAPQNDWIDPFPDDVPERDIYEDLVSDEKTEVLRQAEQLFARPGRRTKQDAADVGTAPEEPVTAQDAEIAAPQVENRTPRILPDLLAQARDEERQVQERLDLEHLHLQAAPTRSPAKAKPRPAKRPPAPANDELPLERPLVSQGSAALSAPDVDVPSPLSRELTNVPRVRRSGQLPLGQRWKERRLPRVCWEQPGRRWRQRG